MSRYRFDGRTAIVTGAGGNPSLGRAHALLLAERGANVVVNDIGSDPETPGYEGVASAEAVAAEIRSLGGNAVADTNSVASEAGVRAIMATAMEAYGRVDILVNNAAISIAASLEEMSDRDFERHLDINLMGPVRLCRAVYPQMRERGFGRIVNVTSGALTGFALLSAYGASKGGLLSFTRAFAAECEGSGVQVNAVNPGAFTRMISAQQESTSPMLQHAQQNLPAELVSPVVAWLAHESCPLNGECVEALGGEVRSLYIAATEGFRDSGLTVEALAERWPEVFQGTTVFAIPQGAADPRDWAIKPYPGNHSSAPSACPISGGALQLTGEESRLDPLIRNDPYPFYRAMREQKPVYYDAKLDLYLVSRYDDVMTVLRDPLTFSLEHGYQDRYANGFVDELAEIMNRDGGGFIRDIIACDPPEHTRLRKLLESAFTAHRVKTLEPGIRKIVVDLLEPLAEQGHADGMKDIGAPLTAQIICEQLGFDFDEVGTEKIASWTTALLAQIGRMQTRDEVAGNAREICDLQNYIMPRIRERETQPREDMISDLVHARLDDEERPRLSFEEQVSCVRALLIAGNDTTAAAITNLLLVLAGDPELQQKLYASVDDERVMSRFVEELLRMKPPVHGLFRTAMHDVELGGTQIPALAQVCVLFASANEDEAKFPGGEEMQLERNNAGRHLTFGAGIHLCIGASLARMEIKVAAQEIIRRLANIELAVPVEELEYLPTLATHTLTSLPLKFSRRT